MLLIYCRIKRGSNRTVQANVRQHNTGYRPGEKQGCIHEAGKIGTYTDQ
jgi:hypothetical protein